MCPTDSASAGAETSSSKSALPTAMPPFAKSLWSLGIDDAHCHPTDNMNTTRHIPNMRTRTLTIMSTRHNDQKLVAETARQNPGKTIPAFGWHPWFSHMILDDIGRDVPSKHDHYAEVLTPVPPDDFIAALPEPKLLSELLAETRAFLLEFPNALVGEVGLDRTFRLPSDPTGKRTSTTGKKLSPYKVLPAHQKRLLEAQLRLAGELKRSVSVHGVGAHGALYEVFESLFKGHERRVESKRDKWKGRYDFQGESDDEDDTTPKPFPPRICLHSFSAPPPFLRTWLNKKLPAEIYFSFSTTINSRYGDKFTEMLGIVPEDRLLVESDLDQAGAAQEQYLEDVVQEISRVRGWTCEQTVKTVGTNYQAFINGRPKEMKPPRRREVVSSDEEENEEEEADISGHE